MTSIRQSAVRSLVCLVLVGLAVAAPPAAAAAVGAGQGASAAQPTVVNSCTTITQPGEYVLASDLNDTRPTQTTNVRTEAGFVRACIVVEANDVTLRGNGHAVDGQGAPGGGGTAQSPFEAREGTQVGIVAAPRGGGQLTGVTVRNLTVTDWSVGVLYANVSDSRIRSVTANRNGAVGVEVRGGSGNAVHQVTARDNGFAGVYLERTTGAAVERNSISGSGVAGIDVYRGAANEIRQNTVSRNQVAGVALARSNRNRLATNTVVGTAGDASYVGYSGGLVFVNASDNHVENVEERNNRRWAVYMREGAANNTVTGVDVGPVVSFTGRDVAVAPARGSTPSPPNGRVAVASLNTTGTASGAYARLDVDYGATDGVDEQTIQLYRYQGRWRALPNSTVAPDQNVVSANVTRFGLLAAIGNASAATPTDGGATATDATTDGATTETTTGTSQPGFGVAAAVGALLAAVGALLARRR